MRRKKILYVTRPLAGGMLTHLRSLLNYFPDRWDVSLAAPAFPFPPEFHGNVHYFPLSLQDGFAPRRDLPILMRMLHICREVLPNLVHIHGYRAAMVGLPAAWLLHCPALVTVHNSPAYPAGSFIAERLFRWAVKFLDPAATYYIAVSGALRNELAGFGIPPSKILQIYNGIDPCFFVVKPRCTPGESGNCKDKALSSLFKWRGIKVGTAGRLVSQKGFDLFIRAVAMVAKNVPEAGFFIAGEGPAREQLERLSLFMRMEKRIFFLGEVKAMPDFYSSLDIFVLASRSEGLSISLLEAGAAGVARIASATGGIPEIISHMKTGLLFPPEDVGALARSMEWLALRPQERVKMGKAASAEIAANFTEKSMLQATEKVYESIILQRDNEVRNEQPVY